MGKVRIKKILGDIEDFKVRGVDYNELIGMTGEIISIDDFDSKYPINVKLENKLYFGFAEEELENIDDIA